MSQSTAGSFSGSTMSRAAEQESSLGRVTRKCMDRPASTAPVGKRYWGSLELNSMVYSSLKTGRGALIPSPHCVIS